VVGGILRMFLPAKQQPEELWTNGGYRSIRCIGKVQKPPSTEWLQVGITGGQKVNSEFLTCGNQRCFCPCTNNHWSYRQMEATAGFSMSKRSINALPRNSNGSCRLQYRWKRTRGRNFEIENVFACEATTKWRMTVGFSASNR
jgi:hypothetical protein